jgi:DNA-binding GntR family transcriptional regulator
MDNHETENEFVPQYPISLVDQVAEFLTKAILEGRYRNGQRLVENELQRKFGVSRAPIREAFFVLERNGLLTNIPRKGRFVRTINEKDIEENFVVRAHLESLAVRLAVPHLGPEDFKKMDSALSAMTLAAKGNDFKTYYRFHYEFHGIFIRVSKNDTLVKILENLRYQTIWFQYSHPSAQERPYEYLISVHRQILDLCIKKDVDELEHLVKKHILVSLDGLLRHLASRKQDGQDTEKIGNNSNLTGVLLWGDKG